MNLKKYFEQIKYISLTTDLWENKQNRYFLTLVAHFFTKDYKLKSIVLSIHKFPRLATNITEFIESELKKINIFDKIVSITTNNELTFNVNKKIEKISCLCQNLNIVVKNGLKLWLKPVFVNLYN